MLKLIDQIQTVSILNIDTDESNISETDLISKELCDSHSFIVSDVDEELIILLEFKCNVDLHIIKLYALSNNSTDIDMSAPKQVHIYKVDGLNKSFNDIKDIKPNKSIICSSKKLQKGQTINLKKDATNSIRFKCTKYMAIYIESNQNDTEKTYLNGITLKGIDDKRNKKSIVFEKKDVAAQKTDIHTKNIHMINNMLQSLKKNAISTSTTTTCSGDISQCSHIPEFVATMKRYHHDQGQEKSNDAIAVLNFINDYIHLIHEHNDDESFEIIVNMLDECDIKQCNMFKRNYGERVSKHKKPSNQRLLDVNDKAFYGLMDKMHCYWYHVFDIGNRLRMRDKMNAPPLNDNKSEYITFIKQQIIKLRKIHHVASSALECRVNHRYNALLSQHVNNEDCVNSNQYKYGYIFKYISNKSKSESKDEDDDSKDDEKDESPKKTLIDTTIISIEAKYESLKEEITSNEISVISMEQFTVECIKSDIYGNCQYKKRVYFSMTMEHLLSIMIYCNYDQLQYEFSKTYRENQGKQHNEFYWMGLYLKQSVHRYGKLLEDDEFNVNRFYHGVGDKLLFLEFQYISIYCPLSTSSSFEVAANFTNNNNGLIIEFSMTEENNFVMNKCRTLPVSWLSDFGNESEYLFIQNQDFLKIESIVDAKLGVEYDKIVQCLNGIDAFSGIGTWNETLCDPSICTVIFEVISKISSSNTLDKYCKEMCTKHLEQRNNLSLCHAAYKHLCLNCQPIHNLFYDSETKWFNLEFILSLYPNITSLAIECEDLELDMFMIDELLEYLFKNDTKLLGVSMGSVRTGQLSELFSTSKYRTQIIPNRFTAIMKKNKMTGDTGWITVYRYERMSSY